MNFPTSPAPSCPPPSWRQLLGRASAFFGLSAFFYLSVLTLMAIPLRGGLSFWERLERHALYPGSDLNLQRFREAEGSGPVEMMILGSSHAYRGFDTAFLRRSGFPAFNLGCPAQTPLNSLGLYQIYRKKMRPKIVVIEAYPATFDIDGLEDFYGIVANIPLRPQVAVMAWNLKHGKALEALYVVAVQRRLRPLEWQKLVHYPGNRYVPGGYVECWMQCPITSAPKPKKPRVLTVRASQMGAFISLLRQVKADGARAVVVVQPTTKSHRAKFSGYLSNLRQIQETAQQEGAKFFQYEDQLPLDPHRDYMDDNHLNARGVRIFNEAFLRSLRHEDSKSKR